MIRRAALVIVGILALACSSPAPDIKGVASPSTVTGGHLGSIGTAGCKPAAAFPEAGMDTSRGSIWAFFFDPLPPRVGQELKVLWRMTGDDDFTFKVSDMAGNTIPLISGPTEHISSSFVHPGNEVGTFFKFPHAGCWQIHIAKPEVDADLWLEVAA